MKKKAKSRKKTATKPKSKPKAKAKAKSKDYHVTSKDVTEQELTQVLNEDLRDAWDKLRAYAAELGEQRIYASHRSIMFSKKHCYFFVRPKKNFIEVVIFLPHRIAGLKELSRTKTKVTNLFKLVHPDQVEEPLTDYIREAFEFAPR